MATLEITVAAYQLKCAECADALGTGDTTTARVKCAQATAILAGMALKMGNAGELIEQRESLRGLKDAIDAVEVSGTRAADDQRMIFTTMGRS